MIGTRISKTKYMISMTWDDAPHLSKDERSLLWDSLPPHERDARSKGIPSLGSGAVYPVQEERIKCKAFDIPEYWPRAYALDVGWNNTAALWGVWDRESDIVYIYSEYKASHAEPATHVDAIRSRGSWIPGVIDPASRGRSQHDGVCLLDEYQGMGLDLDMADNSVESGIHKVYRRMVSGRLQIFDTCVGLWQEFRIYQRDKNGKIVKKNDHLQDCLRYLIVSGMERAVDELTVLDFEGHEEHGQSGRNATTGY